MDLLWRRPLSLGGSHSDGSDTSLIISRVTFPLQLLGLEAVHRTAGTCRSPGVAERERDRASSHEFERRGSVQRNPLPAFTLVTLAIIYGYLMETRKWVRVVLALSGSQYCTTSPVPKIRKLLAATAIGTADKASTTRTHFRVSIRYP